MIKESTKIHNNERVPNIEELLKAPDQILLWNFINKRLYEYLELGLRGRIVIDLQNGRINIVYDQATIAGVSHTSLYMDRVGN